MSCEYDNSMYCTIPNDGNIVDESNCYNCHEDCPGILDIYNDDDPDSKIQSIFVEEKGYYVVNVNIALLNGVMTPCLELYSNEALKFQKNMASMGFVTQIRRNPSKKYLRNVFFSGHNPRNMIHIFENLEVIK